MLQPYFHIVFPDPCWMCWRLRELLGGPGEGKLTWAVGLVGGDFSSKMMAKSMGIQVLEISMDIVNGKIMETLYKSININKWIL